MNASSSLYESFSFWWKKPFFIGISIISSLLFFASFELWVLSPAANWREVSSSVLGLLIIIALSYIAWKCIVQTNIRALIITSIFSLLYSVALVFSSNIINNDDLYLTKVGTYLAIAGCIPFLSIITSRILLFFSPPISIEQDSKIQKHPKFFTSYLGGQKRYSYLIMWAFILISWIPFLLAEWPGAWTFDVLSQTQHLLTEDPISAHHPVIHTLWLSGCIWLSDHLIGSYAPGLAFYTLTQMFILSALLARVVLISSRWNIPPLVPTLMLLAYAFFPGFSLWSVIATKDVLFFGLFAFCLALLIDLLISVRSNNVRKNQWIHFGIALLFLFLFRNNAVYGFALFLIIALFVLKKYRKQFLLVSISVFCVYSVLTGPFSDAAGITPGDKREMLSVPMSQLACVLYNDETVPESDRNFIKTYIPNWEKYDPHIADPIKNTFNTDAFLEDPLYFIKGYTKIGLEHPSEYINAFASLNVGFWAPSMAYTGNEMKGEMTPFKVGNRDIPKGEYISIETNSKLPQLYSFLINARDQKIELGIPGLASLFQIGTWVWVIVFYVASCIFNKNKLLILPSLFFFCYWFTLFFGPVSIYRYGVVAAACAPIFIAVMMSMKRSTKISQSSTQ